MANTWDNHALNKIREIPLLTSAFVFNNSFTYQKCSLCHFYLYYHYIIIQRNFWVIVLIETWDLNIFIIFNYLFIAVLKNEQSTRVNEKFCINVFCVHERLDWAFQLLCGMKARNKLSIMPWAFYRQGLISLFLTSSLIFYLFLH